MSRLAFEPAPDWVLSRFLTLHADRHSQTQAGLSAELAVKLQ
jgi:hypothetical protein